MPYGVEHDYDKYDALKNEAFKQVTLENARQKLEDAKERVMQKLKILDVENVREVEELYLIVAELTQAASFVAAINKAARKGTSFDDEIGSIGLDDVNPILVDAFKDHPEMPNLYKIEVIDYIYEPAKQAWAGLHGRVLIAAKALNAPGIVAEAIEAYKEKTAATLAHLKEHLPKYKQHLEDKLKEHGVEIPIKKDIEVSEHINKMIQRYKAITTLESYVQKVGDPKELDIEHARGLMNRCLKNKPEWIERPFLQQLTDMLSLGMKPLYRAFFSQEKELQNTLTESLDSVDPPDPPKMGR